jgi:hypothetical protein
MNFDGVEVRLASRQTRQASSESFREDAGLRYPFLRRHHLHHGMTFDEVGFKKDELFQVRSQKEEVRSPRITRELPSKEKL